MNSLDERRLSANGRNAYISLSEENKPKPNIYDPEYNRNYLTAKMPVKARSCSPQLQANKQTITHSKIAEENKTKENMKNNNEQPPTHALKTSASNTSDSNIIPSNSNSLKPLEINSGESTNIFNPGCTVSINETPSKGAVPKVRSENPNMKQAVLPGMLRYININKRNRSPQNSELSLKRQKVNDDPLKNNRYALLSEVIENESNEDSSKKTPKPPPIFLREPSSSNLVKTLIELVGKENFHIVPLNKGGIKETKIVIYTEDNYRKLSQYLNDNKKNFYTYQLKSSKGLNVVVKGIESSVDPSEIKEALEEKGFKIKAIVNIFNREKIPQPLFRVELEPDDKKLKGNEIHPIYSLRYLLNRRIQIEEPLKRKGPVQCGNCQEFGHTKNYCTLRTVCAACGDLHLLKDCKIIKDGLVKKCGNCGGDHSANYRGCPVYKTLLKRLREKQKTSREEIIVSSAGHLDSINRFTNQDFPMMPMPNSYANALKSASQQPNIPHNMGGLENNIRKQDFSVKPGTVSYSNILKSGNHNIPHLMGGLENNVSNQDLSVNPGTASYSNILKSGNQKPNIPHNMGGLENLMYTLTQNITSLNQNITNFMTSMQNTIQELLRAQNQMIQILLTKK